MKLPVSFGNKFFFRVVFPGAVLAASLVRFTQSIISFVGFETSLAYVFTVQTIILGWIFVILDMPIYMLFEGRRFWPLFLLKAGRRRERARLLRLHRTMRHHDASRGSVRPSRAMAAESNRIYLEAAVDISDFPLDHRTSMPCVMWPTRLGNLIAAYEQYPRLKYGLDAVFFWPRIWVSISKDLREEIDNRQAQVDGSLYVVTALAASSVVMIVYFFIDSIFPGALAYKMRPDWDLSAAIVCMVLAFSLYRISLFSHAHFGDLFKSIFDQHRSLVALDDITDLVGNLTADPGLRYQISITRNIAAWRFLRWHRARRPGERKNQRVRLP